MERNGSCKAIIHFAYTAQHSSGNKQAEDDAKKETEVKVKEIESTLTLSGLAFIDGAIIGFPSKMIDGQLWFRPSITIAGPDLVEPWTTQLKSLLNFRHVSSAVGDASGLKMCFGAIYKGHAAVFIQAYTTAYRMGVLEPLREHLAEYFPSVAIIQRRIAR